MKKILVIFTTLVIAFLLAPKNTNATVGDTCCTSPKTYSGYTSQCCVQEWDTDLMQYTYKYCDDTACNLSTEKCDGELATSKCVSTGVTVPLRYECNYPNTPNPVCKIDPNGTANDTSQVACQVECDKTKTNSAGTSKDPSCPPNMIQPISCPSLCCRGALGACDAKDNATPNLGCDGVRINAKNWNEKTYCGSDGLWKYNPTTLKCEQLAANPWDLKPITCQGVTGFDTAIGCIPTGDLKLFLQFILKWAFFASGGIILLLIISTGYTIITSSGNPEKLQGAQENIVALFSGLALIAFSLVLLQAIGADILNLKAFMQ